MRQKFFRINPALLVFVFCFFSSKLLPNFTLCNLTYFGLACVVVKVSFVAFSAGGWLLSPLQTARLKAEAVLVSQ